MTKKTKNDIFKRKKIKQEDFLQALENISKKLIYKFKFGYHEIDDMKQQAAIFALEGLENYDASRPLENFLWTHVRNRLFNFKRDNYYRPDNICESCPFYDPQFKKSMNQCSKFTNKNDCSIYTQWIDRNNIKKNLMQPNNIETSNQEIKSENSVLEDLSNSELINIIEDRIHLKYRETYLKLKGGIRVSKNDTLQLQKHIQSILDEYNNE